MLRWPKPSDAQRKVLILGAKAAVTVFLLLFIVRMIDTNELLLVIREIDAGYVLLGVLAMWVNVALSAYRWQVFLRFFRIDAALRTCARIYAEAVTLNLVLPGSVGGDVFRVYKLGHARGRYWDVLSSVLADRFCSLLVLIALCAAALSVNATVQPGVQRVVWGLAAAVGLGFVFVYLFPISRNWMRYWAYRHLARLVYIVRRLFRGPSRIMAALGLSLAVQVAIFASMYFSLASVSTELARLDLAILSTTLATLAAMIPITLAGFGLREGAVVATLTLFGAPSAEAAAVAAVFAACTLGQCIPGSVSWALTAVNRPVDARATSR
ncbi:MAG: flippase-like domain-containing protein [Alphaproteobacteria bacterium]|nr:flippase-like domain-containing protein [Alphaproteobacteria bacterium]